jgi:hypothetical protein
MDGSFSRMEKSDEDGRNCAAGVWKEADSDVSE